MTRLATLLATLAAVGAGAWIKSPPLNAPPVSQMEAAAAWARENGLRLVGGGTLTATGVYRFHFLEGPRGCAIMAVPLGNADEIMPALDELPQATDRNRRALLLAKVEEMPATATGVNLRRMIAQFLNRRVRQPVLLVADRACMVGADGEPLTPWPSP